MTWLLDLGRRFVDWQNRRRALRDLGRITARECEVDSWSFPKDADELRSASKREDFSAGMRLWIGIQERHPRLAARSPEVLLALLDLRMFDEADSLASLGRSLYPREPSVAEGWARVAQRRGDDALAIERWATVRRMFPLHPTGYSQGASCLFRAGRHEEAATVFRNGLRRFPGDLFIRIEYARFAEASNDWDGAINRWREIAANAANAAVFEYQEAGVGIARCLCKLGRSSEAEDILRELRKTVATNLSPAVELAAIAEARGDWWEAAKRWQDVRSKFPMVPVGYVRAIDALRATDRLDDLDIILAEAFDRFPTNRKIAQEYVSLAGERGEAEEAARRQKSLRQRFPEP